MWQNGVFVSLRGPHLAFARKQGAEAISSFRRGCNVRLYLDRNDIKWPKCKILPRERLQIKFNLENPELNVYNINKYIARLWIQDTELEKVWSLVLGL